jgi:hypothetical protein
MVRPWRFHKCSGDCPGTDACPAEAIFPAVACRQFTQKKPTEKRRDVILNGVAAYQGASTLIITAAAAVFVIVSERNPPWVLSAAALLGAAGSSFGLLP